MAESTIVISAATADSAESGMELDEEYSGNLTDEGDLKSSFVAGDTPVILIPIFPGVTIGSIAVSSGSINKISNRVTRQRTVDITPLLSQDDYNVTYWPTSEIEFNFQGKAPTLEDVGNQLNKINDDQLPATGAATFLTDFEQWKYFPSTDVDDLETKTDTWKIVIETVAEK